MASLVITLPSHVTAKVKGVASGAPGTQPVQYSGITQVYPEYQVVRLKENDSTQSGIVEAVTVK